MKVFLSNVSDIQVGYQSREGIKGLANGSHRLLQARDFDKLHQVDWPNLIRFTPTGNFNKFEIKQEDVLFLARGQENFARLLKPGPTNTLAANSFYILRVNSAIIIPEYLSWWLNQSPAQEYIKLNRSGSSLPFLSVSALSNLEIHVPRIEDQRKIAELEILRKREADLMSLYLIKKSALIEAVCLNAIIE